jgi:predicted DNA-binding antitoxin AbrB/MazE fold protein
MSYQVDAIYDHGVLKPLAPLALPDQSRVTITVTSAEVPIPDSAVDDEVVCDDVARQRLAARELSAEIASLPDRSPNDGFTSADHDRILYGGPT